MSGVAAALFLSACSPLTLAGRLAGNVAGEAAAEAVIAPQAATVVDPQGGNFCPVMRALGWPPVITDDRLNRPLAEATVNTLGHGVDHCGWAAAGI